MSPMQVAKSATFTVAPKWVEGKAIISYLNATPRLGLNLFSTQIRLDRENG
ncbi:Uncharacterised protein [Corynebacterium amycolatum]|nr:Uncharacterised protein [Corynebacterium amycolatum]